MISELEPASAEQEIARIVREELLLGSDRPIPFDQPLGELGVGLDSLGLVNLLTAVENEFGVELSDEFWAERGPLSINEVAEIVRSTAASAAPIRPVDRESPVLHGRLERIEDKLSHRGAAGRAAWSATRAVVPVKRFMWTRTRHLVLERSLEDPAPRRPAPPHADRAAHARARGRSPTCPSCGGRCTRGGWRDASSRRSTTGRSRSSPAKRVG